MHKFVNEVLPVISPEFHNRTSQPLIRIRKVTVYGCDLSNHHWPTLFDPASSNTVCPWKTKYVYIHVGCKFLLTDFGQKFEEFIYLVITSTCTTLQSEVPRWYEYFVTGSLNRLHAFERCFTFDSH